MPSVLEIAFALELAKKGKDPLLYSMSKDKWVITFGFELLFSVSNAGYFRVSVDDAWNGIVVDMWMFS